MNTDNLEKIINNAEDILSEMHVVLYNIKSLSNTDISSKKEFLKSIMEIKSEIDVALKSLSVLNENKLVNENETITDLRMIMNGLMEIQSAIDSNTNSRQKLLNQIYACSQHIRGELGY